MLQVAPVVTMAVEGLSIVPVEVLSMVSTQGGVGSMQESIGSSRSTLLHESWQLAVTQLDTRYSKFSHRDVQHIRKFRNLQRISVKTPFINAPSCNRMPGWQLISRVAPGLSKLKTIQLSGPSSFEVLKVLQGSAQLQQRVTQLTLRDQDYAMTAADMYCLADMKAMAELELHCRALPEDSSGEALAMASAALNKTLQTLRLSYTMHPSSATTAAFPGQLTLLKKLELTARHSQKELDHEAVNRHGLAFVSAVSTLVNLADLTMLTGYAYTAEMQQQALAGLARLTRLYYGASTSCIATIPSVDTLVELDAAVSDMSGDVADAVLRLAQLRRLKAWSLQPSDAWRSQVAQGCRIESLQLEATSDDALRNLPTLPALKRFVLTPMDGVGGLKTGTGRYQHLARFLQRHAASLEELELATDAPFCEVLPDLPVCRVLRLLGQAVERETLSMLSGTHMPELEELSLTGQLVLCEAQPLLELGWLAALPALWRLAMSGCCEELRQAVLGLLEGRPGVAVVFEKSPAAEQ
jgi:hypothetical protein